MELLTFDQLDSTRSRIRRTVVGGTVMPVLDTQKRAAPVRCSPITFQAFINRLESQSGGKFRRFKSEKRWRFVLGLDSAQPGRELRVYNAANAVSRQGRRVIGFVHLLS